MNICKKINLTYILYIIKDLYIFSFYIFLKNSIKYKYDIINSGNRQQK